jgi:Cu(I)/Ag(I) efflux system membrane fusion protein
VDYVYPSLNETTRTVRVRAVLQNPDGALKPGMFGALRLRSAQTSAPTLLIPREALIRTGAQNRVVLVLADGQFKSVEVRPGRIGNTQAEILSGLAAGDRVVSSAQFLIDSESSRTSDFRRMDPATTEADPPETDHSEMDHSQMDHSQMDHSQMGHGGMEHDEAPQP